MLQLSVREYPNWAPCHRILAACYAHLGRLDDARKVIKMLDQITSVRIPNMEHFRIPEQRGFLEGLRRAAGETETE
jgi:adenylate cyclase